MNKKMMILVYMICITLCATSCIQSQHKINLYDAEEILNEGDTYYSSAYTMKNDTLELKRFSGTYTIQTFDVPLTINLHIDWEIERGTMRVLWITADNNIVELDPGDHHFIVTEGMSRLKIITDDVSCMITWHINVR